MKLSWRGLRRPALPESVAGVLPARSGERALAWGESRSGEIVVVASHHLYAVSTPVDGGTLVCDRPWHLVDSGVWDRESAILTVSWVDRAPAMSWRFLDDTDLLQAFRERVQASVVLVEQVDLGDGRGAKVVARKNLATGALLTQAVLGKGVSAGDPQVASELADALARVREQVGL